MRRRRTSSPQSVARVGLAAPPLIPYSCPVFRATHVGSRHGAPAEGVSRAAQRSDSVFVGVYVAAVFVSAVLLFLVQPMFARMVLPLLGGSPAVWNTAIVFYQIVLLAGYAYAYAVTRWLSLRRQLVLHLGVLLLPLLVLPIELPEGWQPPATEHPVFWLLSLLGVAVGLPFFVVAASSPLLQRWFAASAHLVPRDPYFLYGASNLGSLLALLGYPLVVERWLRVGEQ